MPQTIDTFTSHSVFKKITALDNSKPLIPLLDLKQNAGFRQALKTVRGLAAASLHFRLSALQVDFIHDSYSLPRVTLPEIDDLEPAYKQEIQLRDWIINAPKRVVEIYYQGNPIAVPAEFIYSEKGLINQWDFLAALGRENIVVDSSLSLKVLGGLKGDEKINVYVQWDEYFTLFFK